MKVRFYSAIPVLLVLLSLAAVSQEKPETLLPDTFAGWQKTKPSQLSAAPAAADQPYAALLKEYGFTDFEGATYTRPDRKITVRAIRFGDASGAYGAFTFYKEPEMQTENIGQQGASANQRVMFYRQNVLVQVTMDRITAMTAGELRELATLLPEAKGASKNLPTLPAYLPKQAYVSNSAKYVVGPVGLSTVHSPLPAEVVDFSRGAEVAIGKYNTSWGTATMILISYPTPAIAGERLRAIESFGQNPAMLPAEFAGQPLTTKRTGPLAVVVAGQISPADAKSLVASVNYDAEVTWNERAPNAKDNVVDFLLNEAILVGILLGFALLLGIGFGVVRVVTKKYYPGKVFDRPEQIEIIQLKIRE